MEETALPAQRGAKDAATPSRAGWILALAGFCLIYLQFFMIREVTALLRGTEIVILLVTLAYFVGYSVGYGVAGWLSFDRVLKLALVTWALHLTLPFSFRYLGGMFTRITQGTAFTVLLFLTAFALSSFYSVLLPRFIDRAPDGGRSLVRYYSLELLGAVFGVLALLGTAGDPRLTAVVYQAGLAALIGLLWRRPAIWFVAGGAVLAYAALFSPVERHSVGSMYSTMHNLKGPEVLYSANTFYQRVDILRDEDGQRYIYLSGRMNYGSKALYRFNVVLAQLPARLVRPREALIVGSGSMESVKYVSEFAGHVTTVELDRAVVEGSRRHLADVNHVDELANWTLSINDAKQFLGTTDRRFDLIVMDVPAPTTIQLGLVHSVEFYELARRALAPRGVISVSLSGTLDPSRDTPRTVASALLQVFPEVIAYNAQDAKRGFALAGDSLPFTKEDVRAAAAAVGSQVEILERPRVVEIVGTMPPLSADNMTLVVRRSWQHLRDTFVPEAGE